MLNFDYDNYNVNVENLEKLKYIKLPKEIVKYEINYEKFNIVLDLILQNYVTMKIDRSTIQMLHGYIHNNYGGNFKNSCNFIGFLEDGNSKIIFEPKIPVWQVPIVIEMICEEYTTSIKKELIKIPMFLLDFILIHPFHKGNLEMMFLLNDLLLLKQFGVNFNFSRKVYSNLGEFFEVIRKSSMEFNDGKFNYDYFICYYLSAINC